MADFSRARIVDDQALENQTKPSTGLERDDRIREVGDSIRWSAPEIIDPDKFGFTKKSFSKLPSKSTDMYALAMTILEVSCNFQPFPKDCTTPPLQVLTGLPPFGKSPDGSVAKKVVGGARPEIPNPGFYAGLWNLLQLSWSEEYENQESKRPSIALVLEQLQRDSSSWFSAPRVSFPSVASKRLPFSY